jgi:hypothetical protein
MFFRGRNVGANSQVCALSDQEQSLALELSIDRLDDAFFHEWFRGIWFLDPHESSELGKIDGVIEV